jgi:hypothetical protein
MSTDTFRGLTATATTKSEDVSVNTAFNLTVTAVSATQKTVTVSVGSTGRYRLQCWLVDATTTPNSLTASPPTGDATVSWEVVTDADGTYTFTINNTVAGKTWYMYAALGHLTAYSDAISF